MLFYFNIMKCASPMVLLEFQCPTTQVWTPHSRHVFFYSFFLPIIHNLFVFSQLWAPPPFPVYIALWERTVHWQHNENSLVWVWFDYIYFLFYLYFVNFSPFDTLQTPNLLSPSVCLFSPFITTVWNIVPPIALAVLQFVYWNHDCTPCNRALLWMLLPP